MAEEARLQAKILKDLRSLEKYCDVFKIIKTSDDGTPDIFFTTALTGGVFIEVKGPKGVASERQKFRVPKINSCGCRAFFCYSWDEWWSIKRELGMLDDVTVKNAHEKREALLSQS